MRLRAITAACAMTLIIAIPGSASAEALGTSCYAYTDASGVEQQRDDAGRPHRRMLPHSWKWRTRPIPSSHTPLNKTNGPAWVYDATGCTGEVCSG
jgi:hypothetical protein